jgi:hypothetical protein
LGSRSFLKLAKAFSSLAYDFISFLQRKNMKNETKSKHNDKDKNGKGKPKIDKGEGKQNSGRALKSPNMGFHGSDDERNLNAEE